MSDVCMACQEEHHYTADSHCRYCIANPAILISPEDMEAIKRLWVAADNARATCADGSCHTHCHCDLRTAIESLRPTMERMGA